MATSSKKRRVTSSPKSPKKLFVVGTLMTFEHRYLVEAESAAQAEQCIAADIASSEPTVCDWQQTCRGESVLYTRQASRTQLLAEHQDVEAGSPWMPLNDFIIRA